MGRWKRAREMLRLDGKLRTKLGLIARNGLGCQPWADTEPAPVLGTLVLEMNFESEIECAGCELAIEDPASVEVELNGEIVPSDVDTGWWVDHCIRKVPLPVVIKGTNALCIRIPYTRKTDLEWLYLLGGFWGSAREGRAESSPRCRKHCLTETMLSMVCHSTRVISTTTSECQIRHFLRFVFHSTKVPYWKPLRMVSSSIRHLFLLMKLS